jgi:DNA repair exonuclease SbcCD ATPase subunit
MDDIIAKALQRTIEERNQWRAECQRVTVERDELASFVWHVQNRRQQLEKDLALTAEIATRNRDEAHAVSDRLVATEARRERRAVYGVDCPGCRKVQPKRTPTVLMPQQRCKVCGYRDPRPSIWIREDT